MGREPVKCNKCGVYLSGKNRDNPDKICSRCSGTTYTKKIEQGRKILH